MAAIRPKGILQHFFRAPVFLYRWRCGWLLGNRFMLLVHVGRLTGRRYETVLEVMECRDGVPEAVVMSAFGPNADWLRNIQTTRDPEVTIGSRRFVAAHRVLGEEEAMSVVRGYERRNRFMEGIIHSVLSRLLGWRYHGTEFDRRRLVTQLPLIAFRPRR